MSSKKRLLNNIVRQFNRTLKMRSWEVYQHVLRDALKVLPNEEKSKVLAFITAKDFAGLLDWADSFGGVEHSSALDTFKANQLTALIRKYPFPLPQLKEQSRAKAIEKFLHAENSCKRYNLKFRRVGITKRDPYNEILIQASFWIRKVIGDKPDLPSIYKECGFGPGASIGVHGNSTNLARKLLADEWTCTPTAFPFAAAALAQDQHIWELIFPNYGEILCLDPQQFYIELQRKVRLVQHNKIVTVPKTALVDRTIAIEPLLNGYVQKGVDNFLRLRLKRVGIDLADQTVNQDLARIGSLPNQDDPFITIDLSSASDLINQGIVKRLLPADWFEFLNSIRSPMYELDGNVYRYHKFTSMGNGFCFPLETLIFASVCNVLSSPLSGEYSVYGDDIIVRQSVATKVLRTLRYFGFRHNPDKTFLKGPFRESCGADWFEGLNVRPLTLDYRLDSLESLIKFYNMSLRRDFCGFFDNIREYILGLVPRSIFFCRPYQGTIDGAFEVPMDMFQASKYAHFDRKIFAWAWLELETSGVADSGTRSHERYSTALMMALLRGSPSRKPFSKRRETSRSVRQMAYAGATSTWLPPRLA